jgi:5-enolpyruvylshikimate-3-phosphate synthase
MASVPHAYNRAMGVEKGSAEHAPLGLVPGAVVDGRFRPGGSKSLAQRALLAAALAHGTTRIEGLPDAEDVRAALGLLAVLGVLARAPESADSTGHDAGKRRAM